MKNTIQIILLFFATAVSATSQTNEITSVLLSKESDYEYWYKPKTREQLLIDYQGSIVYYRKKAKQKFKVSAIPVNFFFKDSINYQKLDELIVGMTNEDRNCYFRNKGSIIITLITGDSNHNYSQSFEFGSVISCKEDDQYIILRKIEEEFLKFNKQVFN